MGLVVLVVVVLSFGYNGLTDKQIEQNEPTSVVVMDRGQVNGPQ